jgi:hypothetical protein
MRIGILTFHRAHNYGAVLQAYALQEIIKGLGHEVEIIDYRQPVIEKNYYSFSLRRCFNRNPFVMLKSICNEFKMLFVRPKKVEIFKRFAQKWLLLSEKKIYSSAQMPDDYDLYIHGSDQIWNSKFTKGFDEIYLGHYKTKKDNKITYAVSFKAEQFSKEDLMARSLKNFVGISVREKYLIEFISPLTKQNIKSCLDPTLLTNDTFWKNFVVKPKEEDYLLVYLIAKNDKALPFAERMSKLLGLKLIVLENTKKCKTVEEFVGYFKYASFIISTSFHGTAFSIIFRKPFFTVTSNFKNDVRYISLLDSLGISERLVDGENIFNDEISEIDYDKVYERLNNLQKESLEYLNLHLNYAKE